MFEAVAADEPRQLLQLRHVDNGPSAEGIQRVVSELALSAVGEGRMTPGAEAIIRAADSTDPRPMWVSGHSDNQGWCVN